MTRREIRDALHTILNSHDAALAAIRAANDAMRTANDAMRTASDGMRGAIDRHDDAIVSAIEANRAAIGLLTRMEQEGVEGEGAS